MKIKSIYIISIILIISLQNLTANVFDNIKKKKEQKKEIHTLINKYSTIIEKEVKSKKSIRDKIAFYDKEISRLSRETKQSQIELNKIKNKLDYNKKQAKNIKDKIYVLQKIMQETEHKKDYRIYSLKKNIVYLNSYGMSIYNTLFFDKNNDLIDRLSIIQLISKILQNSIVKIKNNINNYDRTLKKLNNTKNEYESIIQKQLQIKDKYQKINNKQNINYRKLVRIRKTKKRYLNKVNKNILNYKQKVSKLKNDLNSITSLLKKLNREASIKGEFYKNRGNLIWPTKGKIVKRFGTMIDPDYKTKIFWPGIDIKGKFGDKVVAANKGEIVFAGWQSSFGNTVIINHGNNYYTLYSHLINTTVKSGQKITGGQIIGYIGDTGDVQDPILHFQIRKDTNPLDPLKWLRHRF